MPNIPGMVALSLNEPFGTEAVLIGSLTPDYDQVGLSTKCCTSFGW